MGWSVYVMPEYNYKEFWEGKRGQEPASKWTETKVNKVGNILGQLEFKSSFEVGCGDGEFSKLLLNKTKKCKGIDLSQTRVDLSPYKDKKCGDFLEYRGKKKYDLVCCSHVLLHVPMDKINEFYEKMEDMAEKYILLIEPDIKQVGTTGWAYYNFPYDYDEMFGPFEIIPVEERVNAYLKRL